MQEENSPLLFNERRKRRKSVGKKYLTDATDTKTLLRLMQSIPSLKVEPFKIGLAEIGTVF